jgi:predicted nucleic acid-binding protein
VRVAIADTGPIDYLVLIGNIDLLPVLFEKVILPSAVQAELTDPDAPPSVRNWIADPPAWLDVHETPSRQFDQASVEGLGRWGDSRNRLGHFARRRSAAHG